MIRVLIDVSPAESGWTATISAPGLPVPIERHISRRGGFPVPAAGDLPDGLDAGARLLATADDPGPIDNLRINLAVRQARKAEIAEFGDYLHAVLFGRYWQSIVRVVAGQCTKQFFELALRWPVTEWELARLPWEIMRAPNPQTGKWEPVALTAAITRIVPRQFPENKLRIQPKVLFVIGTDLNDVSIRPGAEFFTVWDRLVREQVPFDFRILQRASSEEIEDELDRFAPSIVHFICHGSEAAGSGFLELVSVDSSGRLSTDQRNAERCLALLRGKRNTYPPIVVLSACYSGGGASSGSVSARVDAPLAAALVQGGVPIVVGMGGEVSDQACRLFARRFYEALLHREPVTDATFEGRRAGIKHGPDAETSVDWALPVLFMADGLDPAVEVDQAEVDRVKERADRASLMRGPTNPAAFCDRIEILNAQRALTSPGRRERVLVLEETDFERDPFAGNLGQFGKTRVLREIAARLILDGHLPCLLTIAEGDAPPTSAGKLLGELVKVVNKAAKSVGRSTRIDSQLLRLRTLLNTSVGGGGGLDLAVKDEYEIWRARVDGDAGASAIQPEPPASLIAEALRADLRALAALGRAEWDSPELRVVLLVDDVHQFDVATRTFVQMIGPDGLGDRYNPVPVVFAFSSQPQQTGLDHSIEVLRKFVEDNSQSPYFSHMTLERFKSPNPDPFGVRDSQRTDPLALVYRDWLLNLDPGIVVRAGAEEKAVRWFFDRLHKQLLGVPSRLFWSMLGSRVEDFIADLMSQQAQELIEVIIEHVDDETALTEFRGLVR